MSGQKEIVLGDGLLEAWCQLSPVGVFMGNLDGKPVKQVCDMEAFGRVIAAFAPEVLVDFEHRAENTDDTTAAGWAQELRASEENGLEARIRFTDLGTDAVRNRRLRFLSPVWPLGADGRPEALKSVALTNTPNFNLRPVLNKATAGADIKTKGVRMTKLAKLFGLPETATEDEILAAAEAKAQEQAALAKRVAELEKGALEAEAEGAYEENKGNIANKEAFVACYVQNKAAAASMLATFKKPVCNKADAKAPSFKAPGASGAVQNKYTEWSAMPPGAAKDAFLRANATEINLSAPAE